LEPLQIELAIVKVFELATERTNDLDLNIDLDKTFTERVDLDETGINSTIESTEFGNETDITLRDRFVGVRTDDAARNGTHGSNAGTKSVDCARHQLLFAIMFAVAPTYSCFHTSREHLGRSLQQASGHSWAGDPLFSAARR
jgi:hypothetical protein